VAASPRTNAETAAEIDRLATALAKDPKSKAFMPLAEAYIKAGMWAEASVVLEDGLKVYPGFVTAMAALGRVYDQLNQPVKAKAILEEVVKQSPDNLRAHRVLAKLYAAEGKADLALRSCSAILAVNVYDEEARSIRRAITGAAEDDDSPRAKRAKKRAALEARSEPKAEAKIESSDEAAPAPLVTAAAPVPDSSAPAPTVPTEPPVHPQAATIARLEGWLRIIQTKRTNPSTSL